jgi:hypothetical protein
MKRRSLTIPGYKHREWEQAKNVYVYATEGVELNNVEKTKDIINDVIEEFNLPLQILNGNADRSEDTHLVENLITGNSQENLLDGEGILKELRRYWNEGVLRYGLIVLVNPGRYEFRKKPSDNEPAIYGWAHSQGLVVLRGFDIQNAVRHEFGHMVGLGFHHQGCVMDWNCSVHKFCEKCRKDIEEIWDL